VLSGQAARAAEKLGVRERQMKLTHAGGQAMAFVIAEG
jgi:hypothetical protein